MHWSIGNVSKERLEIEIQSPPANASTEGYDWITAQARICVGCFQGQTKLSITKTDIVRFRDELLRLYETLKGIAEFTTIESQIYLKVVTDNLGHMTVSGNLSDDCSFGNQLEFTIEIDQSHLKRTISEINAYLKTADRS
jgi:hypothetical protein